MTEQQQLLRLLPAVDRVLREDLLQSQLCCLPQEAVSRAVQQSIGDLRRELLQQGSVDKDRLTPSAVALVAWRLCQSLAEPSLRRVINATGTLLHTNLGRAPLADQALQAINDVAAGYSNLEFDLDRGVRGHRYSHVERLLCELTGAEAALVVNNNSGAVLLALSALGQGKEAIVSRGELVEIGGAFRIPDVMEAGGVKLREVGTSNRTHLRDYENAVTEETAILLKVHTSNYRIIGFTKDVPARDLLPLATEKNLILMEDLGSGLLIDLSRYGLEAEPTVPQVVQAGVDVISFSGDKLLGGPQAGLVVGKKRYLDKLRNHPLARALRIDKLTLAALEATLRLYLKPEVAKRELPVLRMFAADPEEQKERCERLAKILNEADVCADLKLTEDISRVGGGAMPLTELPDWAIEIRPRKLSVATLGQRLRGLTPAVVGRSQDDALLINLRAVFDAEEELLARSLIEALN